MNKARESTRLVYNSNIPLATAHLLRQATKVKGEWVAYCGCMPTARGAVSKATRAVVLQAPLAMTLTVFPFQWRLRPCARSCATQPANLTHFLCFLAYREFSRKVAAIKVRCCDTTFRIRTTANGAVPVRFRNSGVTLATVSFRAKPLVLVPTTSPPGTFVLAILFW